MNTKTNSLAPAQNGHMPAVTDGKIDARDLHESLEIKTPFTMWMERRIKEYDFEEGGDLHKIVNPNGRIDYELTLDTAKELAMVERNDRGRQIRRYFIECEKSLRTASMQPAASLGTGTLAKLQQVNAGLIEVATEHSGRIAQLESTARAGEDWKAIAAYLQDEWGLTISSGRVSYLSRLCLQHSAMHHFPVGEDRSPSGSSRRTFAPQVLDACIPHTLERWDNRDRQNGKELF